MATIERPYLHKEVQTLNSVQIEEERLAQQTFAEEAIAILNQLTEDEVDKEHTPSLLVSVAQRTYPLLKPFSKETNEILDRTIKTDPLWVQWAVIKTLVWESVGPVKFGNIFKVEPARLTSHITKLNVRKVELARAKVGDLL